MMMMMMMMMMLRSHFGSSNSEAQHVPCLPQQNGGVQWYMAFVRCLFTLLIASQVVLHVMPHSRSHAKSAERWQRAVDRGYAQHILAGRQRIEVASEVAGRLKTLARSLEMHREHNLLAGHASHSGVGAALNVRN
eukprot:9506520-Karenia_brevis.AAC.1